MSPEKPGFGIGDSGYVKAIAALRRISQKTPDPHTPALPKPESPIANPGSPMIEKEIVISNKLGLHARASAKLVQTLHDFQASAFLACRGKEVNAKSIMGVM